MAINCDASLAVLASSDSDLGLLSCEMTLFRADWQDGDSRARADAQNTEDQLQRRAALIETRAMIGRNQ